MSFSKVMKDNLKPAAVIANTMDVCSALGIPNLKEFLEEFVIIKRDLKDLKKENSRLRKQIRQIQRKLNMSIDDDEE